jgi:hypothetical protein
MTNHDILKDVDGFLEKTGMAESTLGRKALNDGKAIARLRAGKRMWPETIDKLREFMTAEAIAPSAAPQHVEAAE